MNIKPLSQRDPRWSARLLGFNTEKQYSIGNYGCLITCITMACNYYGKNETPATINDKLKSVNGFSNGGLYNWGYIEKVFPDIDEQWLGNYPNELTSAQMKTINDAIDAGYPVMVEIDFSPETSKTDMHYVLLIARNSSDENDFTMADPWTGSIGSLKLYLRATRPTARKSIEQVIIYKGKVPTEPTPVDPCKDYKAAVDKFIGEAYAVIDPVAPDKTLDNILIQIKTLSNALAPKTESKQQGTKSLISIIKEVLHI